MTSPFATFVRFCLSVWASAGLAVLAPSATAETMYLATGDYPPFVAEKDEGYGVTAAIVQAALYAAETEAAFAFLPWKRGYIESEAGKHTGTFPYLRTPERELAFLYSEPIFDDRFDIFVRADRAPPVSWQGEHLCIPLGYDQTQIAGFIAQNQIIIDSPSAIQNCLQMLKAGRVQGVWVSELVAAATSRELYGREHLFAPTNMNLVGKVSYYLIVSRKLGDAPEWIKRFNAGLKTIRANGTYERIVAGYMNN